MHTYKTQGKTQYNDIARLYKHIILGLGDKCVIFYINIVDPDRHWRMWFFYFFPTIFFSASYLTFRAKVHFPVNWPRRTYMRYHYLIQENITQEKTNGVVFLRPFSRLITENNNEMKHEYWSGSRNAWDLWRAFVLKCSKYSIYNKNKIHEIRIWLD